MKKIVEMWNYNSAVIFGWNNIFVGKIEQKQAYYV